MSATHFTVTFAIFTQLTCVNSNHSVFFSRPIDPLASVVVNHTGGPAILHKSFTMHCEVVGSVDRIWWWKNDNLIYADNTTDFSMGNKTLTLNPVQKSDNGNYKCQAFNYVSNMTSSPFMVEVNCKYLNLSFYLSFLCL